MTRLYDTPTMPEPKPPALDARRRRLLFRATHRGTHETDILLGGFVAPRIHEFTDSDLHELEQLLQLPDPDLVDWLTGRRPAPPEADTPLLRRIKEAAR
jgi:antitoxin CptB